ncbi:hypothetical protein SLS64_004621 [Diaporthe eres]
MSATRTTTRADVRRDDPAEPAPQDEGPDYSLKPNAPPTTEEAVPSAEWARWRLTKQRPDIRDKFPEYFPDVRKQLYDRLKAEYKLPQEFVVLASQVARGDRTVTAPKSYDPTNWEFLFLDDTFRVKLMVGVMAKLLEKNVFNSLLFGAADVEKTALMADDHSRAFLDDCLQDLWSDNFWIEVDSVTMGILDLLLPLINLLGQDIPDAAWPPLTKVHQGLHDIVAEAAWFTNGMRATRSVFWIQFALPGELNDITHEHAIDDIWNRSKARAKELDDNAEAAWEAQVRKKYPGEDITEAHRAAFEKDTPRPFIRRTAKVQVAMWPFIKRYTTVGESDAGDGGYNAGEIITQIMKAQCVYYSGDDSDEADMSERRTLSEQISSRRWAKWFTWRSILLYAVVFLLFSFVTSPEVQQELEDKPWAVKSSASSQEFLGERKTTTIVAVPVGTDIVTETIVVTKSTVDENKPSKPWFGSKARSVSKVTETVTETIVKKFDEEADDYNDDDNDDDDDSDSDSDSDEDSDSSGDDSKNGGSGFVSTGAGIAAKVISAKDKVTDGIASAKDKVTDGIASVKDSVASEFASTTDSVAESLSSEKDRIASIESSVRESVKNSIADEKSRSSAASQSSASESRKSKASNKSSAEQSRASSMSSAEQSRASSRSSAEQSRASSRSSLSESKAASESSASQSRESSKSSAAAQRSAEAEKKAEAERSAVAERSAASESRIVSERVAASLAAEDEARRIAASIASKEEKASSSSRASKKRVHNRKTASEDNNIDTTIVKTHVEAPVSVVDVTTSNVAVPPETDKETITITVPADKVVVTVTGPVTQAETEGAAKKVKDNGMLGP